MGIDNFAASLLYNRNKNWVSQLEKLMPEGPLVVAAGSGHLVGAKGLINLLRKMGYKVEPVRNDMNKDLSLRL